MRIVYLQDNFEPEVAFEDGPYCPIEYWSES
jgi:hypothetical protein